MKVALAVLVAVALALVVAARVPRSAAVLEDVPGIGWVVELIGVHEPIEVALAFDHAPRPDELARARQLLAAQLGVPVEIRGDVIVVGGDDPLRVYRLHLQHAPLRVFTVVYESPEIEALRKVLVHDDQAKRLGLSVQLDRIGEHIAAPNDSLYVNDAWVATHHCTGRHIEGAGTACWVTAKQRFDAYVRGDPDLFIDAHPLALPAGRNFYATDAGPIYELESRPLEVPVTRLQFAGGEALVPLPAAPPSEVELVVEAEPGKLIAGEVRGDRLAFPTSPELELASLGLRAR